MPPARPRRSSAAYSRASPSVASSSSSTPRTRTRSRGSVTPVKEEQEPKLKRGYYVVERILARSLQKAYGPEDEPEHQYIVRWEGYGPGEDTWQFGSSLMEDCRELLDEFERAEHPFTILDHRQGANGAKQYLIRYGAVSDEVAPSPLLEEAWHSPSTMRNKMELSKWTVDEAIKEYHEAKERGEEPRPCRVQANKDCVLISVLESRRRRAKHNSPSTQWYYRVQWSDRRAVKDEWFARYRMDKRFGAQQAKGAVERFFRPPEAKEEVPDPAAVKYENERRQNMEENANLLKQLGLAA